MVGKVRHEFARPGQAGTLLPANVPLDGGGGCGVAISPDGHVLSNQHLVAGEIGIHQRESGLALQPSECDKA
jgi:hypothetical protein